jgi:hypothetical protein
MRYTYEKITTDFGISIKRTNTDGVVSWIPVDESNSDYQAYLKELTESVTNDPKGNK